MTQVNSQNICLNSKQNGKWIHSLWTSTKRDRDLNTSTYREECIQDLWYTRGNVEKIAFIDGRKNNFHYDIQGYRICAHNIWQVDTTYKNTFPSFIAGNKRRLSESNRLFLFNVMWIFHEHSYINEFDVAPNIKPTRLDLTHFGVYFWLLLV